MVRMGFIEYSNGELDWAVNKEEPNFSFFQSPLKETPHVVEPVEGVVYVCMMMMGRV